MDKNDVEDILEKCWGDEGYSNVLLGGLLIQRFKKVFLKKDSFRKIDIRDIKEKDRKIYAYECMDGVEGWQRFDFNLESISIIG